MGRCYNVVILLFYLCFVVNANRLHNGYTRNVFKRQEAVTEEDPDMEFGVRGAFNVIVTPEPINEADLRVLPVATSQTCYCVNYAYCDSSSNTIRNDAPIDYSTLEIQQNSNRPCDHALEVCCKQPQQILQQPQTQQVQPQPIQPQPQLVQQQPQPQQPQFQQPQPQEPQFQQPQPQEPQIQQPQFQQPQPQQPQPQQPQFQQPQQFQPGQWQQQHHPQHFHSRQWQPTQPAESAPRCTWRWRHGHSYCVPY